MKKYFAEFFGTFWLVLGGCGTAVLAGSQVGCLGVALAFGLTVLTMAYAIGPISGAHLNPAVTVGLAFGRRMPLCDVIPYIISQVAGACLAAYVLYEILTCSGMGIKDFACNGYGEHSPEKFSMVSAIITEAVMTFMFLFVILGSTVAKTATKAAPIAIGLCLTLIHLISIPVTNTSVNPARSISQAIFVKGWALDQLWLFIAVPIAAAAVAGLVWILFFGSEDKAE
ncbi:MAG: aquaporin Z [Planctomycetia bacterium]|nr:aquaporin Z [Planctomycetia bacterium]